MVIREQEDGDRPEPLLRIMDARPMVNAMGNALMGKGSEVISRLGGETSTTLEFLSVPNIHVMYVILWKDRQTGDHVKTVKRQTGAS
jgi:hypothetical protein